MRAVVSYMDQLMWANLLALALEAASACPPDEREWIKQAIQEDPDCVGVRAEGDVLHLEVSGRSLVSAHRLALTKPLASPRLN